MKIRSDSKRKILREISSSSLAGFSRFIVFGVLNASAGFLLFLLFFRVLGIHYLAANVLVLGTWAWFGFELQRRWAFRAEKSRKSFIRFLAMRIPLVPLSASLLWAMVEILNLHEEIAYILTIGVITGGSYLVSVLWVFPRTEPST